MKVTGIYKITNPKGKIYIGQSIDIHQRFKTYHNLHCKNQTKLLNSLKKYGVEAHMFEVIEECPDSYLDEIETWWKMYYGSVEKGLNHSYWDHSPMRGKKHTSGAIDKIKQTHIGSKRSEDTKLKMSQNSGMRGVKLSQSHLDALKNANTGRPLPQHAREARSRKIWQYDLAGNFLQEWDSISLVRHTLNIRPSFPSGNTCMRGNFLWVRKTPDISTKIDPYVNPLHTPVIQYDLQGNFIKQWDSISQAENIYGHGINQCCLGKQNTAKGYIWKYHTKDYPLYIPPYVPKPRVVNDKLKEKLQQKITQKDLDGNIICCFNSMKEAELITGVKAHNIGECCRKKQKTAGGFIWTYQE
jgi:group I intron endonuclease